MSSRVDPTLPARLKKLGLIENHKCFNCGHCTAVCQLTEENFVYPRKDIRMLQMGIEDNVSSRVEPWLCYYCGDCSRSCPREAEPAAQMMAMRRYLSTVYDWTGLSRRFYTSRAWVVGALAAIGGLVLFLFGLLHYLNPGMINWEPLADGVALNSFAPVHLVHIADGVMATVILAILLGAVFNMYRKIILSDRKLSVPIHLYFTEAWNLGVHFISQIRFKKCTDKMTYWVVHLFLMLGYASMFLLVAVLLQQFQIDEGINWTTVPGYFATFALLYGSVYFMIGRSKKKEEVHKYSDFIDWLFLVFLFLTALTGILIHVFRYYMHWPAGTYYMYLIHLVIDVPMLMVLVPSKWAHLAYRPFAIYLASVRSKALQAAGTAQPDRIGVAPAVSKVWEV